MQEKTEEYRIMELLELADVSSGQKTENLFGGERHLI